MGMYEVPCSKCGEQFLWYSGDMVQVCSFCNGVDKAMSVETVKRLVVKEGETLLVRFPDTYTDTQMRNATFSLKKIFDKTKVVVYRGDIRFEVIRTEEENK